MKTILSRTAPEFQPVKVEILFETKEDIINFLEFVNDSSIEADMAIDDICGKLHTILNPGNFQINPYYERRKIKEGN